MTELLPGMETERRKPELSQWYTAPELAARIATWALAPFDQRNVRRADLTVLESSAGRGALALALRKLGPRVQCIDIDLQNVEHLERLGFDTDMRDFLEMQPVMSVPPFDLNVQNPPFESGQTERHLLHALKFAPRVVCHCPLTTLAGQARGEQLWSKVHLHRLAICSSRPSYGGKGGATDMCTVDVSLRTSSTPVLAETEVSWWP